MALHVSLVGICASASLVAIRRILVFSFSSCIGEPEFFKATLYVVLFLSLEPSVPPP